MVSATRRAARAASDDPPQTTGLVSARAIASIFAGLTARSRWGEQVTATSSSASATSPWSARGPSPTWSRYSGRTTAVASWSRATVGTIVDQRPSACLATSDPSGHATTTWHPRRTASATAAAVPRSVPSGARTTTRSSPPAQPGRAGPGQATNGTGHHGSSTARNSRESGPAATMARGRAASPAAATAAAMPGAASTASRRTRAPASASARRRRSAAASAASSSRRDSSNQLGMVVGPSGRPTGLVDQEHRDVVADRVGQPALLADQLLADRGEGAVAVGADDDLHQLRVEVHGQWLLIRARTSSRTRVMVPSSAPSTLRRSKGSVLEGRTLNHQSSVVTVRPSRRSTCAPVVSAYAAATPAVAPTASATWELISPLWL